MPLLGIAGEPAVSAHGGAAGDVRLRNDGDGVAAVAAAGRSWILQPGASAVASGPDRAFIVLHDALRLLRAPAWAQLVDALAMPDLGA